MTKYVQAFSAKLDKFLAPMNDNVLVVLATAVFAILAQTLGLLPL